MTTAGMPPYRILAVCTGNICRSPAVERLLGSALDASVEVRSAGTHALVGEPIHPPMATLLTAVGAAVDGFRATQLTESTVRQADLILTLTRHHRASVVDLWPGAVRRTFTLAELARALQLVDPAELPARASAAERLTAALPQAAVLRGQIVPTSPDADDVIDPYGRDEEVYREAFAAIREAVTSIADVAQGR
ncbi:low molecular weight phosphatase family protein [Ruania zhangjianzhongii]|uniref:arsenate reductase/protein-tyrosine-phosphatase family protein n=1 Tax=Ruania zhangjianzhongii TaxID=2603206 RepID=UPI0011CA695B|nr:low molecular weight phosphatase family protein [Ruania zhangjianzhongii]